MNKHNLKVLKSIDSLILELEYLTENKLIIDLNTRRKITNLLVTLTYKGVDSELASARDALEKAYNYYMMGNKRPLWKRVV